MMTSPDIGFTNRGRWFSFPLILLTFLLSLPRALTQDAFLVTASVEPSGSGTITPSSLLVSAGSNVPFTVRTGSPVSSEVYEWRVDGVPVQSGGNAYTLPNVSGPHHVSVIIKAMRWVSGRASANGSLSPSGDQLRIWEGESILFTAQPDPGYEADWWSASGQIAAAGQTSFTVRYTDFSIHSVQVFFRPIVRHRDYYFEVMGGRGSLSPSGRQSLRVGTVVTVQAIPEAGWTVDHWEQGHGGTVQQGGSSYSFTVCEEVVHGELVPCPSNLIRVEFRRSPSYVVTVSAAAGGTISPPGPHTVPQSGSLTLSASPTSGYQVDRWEVDGIVVQTGGDTYTLTNVQANHSVQVTFKTAATTFSVNARAGTGGTISPGGTLPLAAGSSQTFTASPNSGYEVDRWEVDLIPVQTGGLSYTLANVSGNRTVEVLFRAVSNPTHTITASAGSGGSLSPSGAVSVTHGSNPTFTATPNSGYEVDTWRLDGTTVQNGGASYTISNVTGNRSLQVSFRPVTVSPPLITSQPQDQTVAPGVTVTITVAATGTAPLTYRWRCHGVNLTDGGRVSGATSPTLTLANVQASDAGTYDVVVSNSAGSATSQPATLSLASPLALADALGAPELIWTTGGASPWEAQDLISHDGQHAAQSGPLEDLQESWLQTTLTGPGTLSFWWKVSSEATFDWLEFWIGNQRQDRISGKPDWALATFAVPPGPQTLRWRYMKDDSNTAGSDAGWVDQVHFEPASASGLAGWAARLGLPTDQRGPTDRHGPLHLPNLLAYALGLNPLTAQPGDLPYVTRTEVGGQPQLRLVYRLSTTAPEVQVQAVAAAAASAAVWTPVASAPTRLGATPDGQAELWQVKIWADGPAGFFRLEVRER